MHLARKLQREAAAALVIMSQLPLAAAAFEGSRQGMPPAVLGQSEWILPGGDSSGTEEISTPGQSEWIRPADSSANQTQYAGGSSIGKSNWVMPSRVQDSQTAQTWSQSYPSGPGMSGWVQPAQQDFSGRQPGISQAGSYAAPPTAGSGQFQIPDLYGQASQSYTLPDPYAACPPYTNGMETIFGNSSGLNPTGLYPGAAPSGINSMGAMNSMGGINVTGMTMQDMMGQMMLGPMMMAGQAGLLGGSFRGYGPGSVTVGRGYAPLVGGYYTGMPGRVLRRTLNRTVDRTLNRALRGIR